MGDWGTANLHRICGWIAAEMGLRCKSGSRFATWNGRGGADALEALIERRVDLSLFVPSSLAGGMFGKQGLAQHDLTSLRAIAVLPQRDALVIAIDSKLGINSIAALQERRPALTWAVGLDDGVNMVGLATRLLLDAAGIPRALLESWGGAFLEGEAPWDVIPLATSFKADAVIFEAIMTPYWKQLMAARPMTFFSLDDPLVRRLEGTGLTATTVPPGRFAGQESPIQTVDFSDFLLLARADLPEDVAYLLAWCLCETRETIESQYKHLRPEDSPLTYPLDPARMVKAPIALHRGAELYYQRAGLL